MKLKSLKMAYNCMDIVLNSQKEEWNSDLLKEAKDDIEGCIKVVEKQVEELKRADILEAMGTCLCFNILVDFPDRGYWKKDDPLNPYLRAEKIGREQKDEK